jgi:hypothetical protein
MCEAKCLQLRKSLDAEQYNGKGSDLHLVALRCVSCTLKWLHLRSQPCDSALPSCS